MASSAPPFNKPGLQDANGPLSPSALKGPPWFPQGQDAPPLTGISDISQLTGRQKAALLLYSLGTEVSVEVMKHLDKQEARAISDEIAKMSLPNPRVLLQLLKEFQDKFQKRVDQQRDAKRREEEELARNMPFRSLRNLDPEEVASILADEQPQTIALVLSYLYPEQAADVLALFPKDLQTELIERLATIHEIPNELVRKIEAIIDEKAKAYIAEESAPANVDRRMETIARVLQKTRTTSDDLLERIGESNPVMAKELRLRSFTFEDILEIDDRILQRALQRIAPGKIALALKIASEALSDKILGNLEPMTRENVKDQRDLMGPKTLMEIEDAQREIIQIIKQVMG